MLYLNLYVVLHYGTIFLDILNYIIKKKNEKSIKLINQLVNQYFFKRRHIATFCTIFRSRG